MKIEIEISDKIILAASPFHEDLPAGARLLGGKWSDGKWTFDIREERLVRDLYIDIFGTDGTVSELLDVELTFKNEVSARCSSVFLMGREICRAKGRDSGATLGNSVVLKIGRIRSGGSAKNWESIIDNGSILIVRDLPKIMIERFEHKDIDLKIIGSTCNKEALQAEKEKIITRLAQIEEMLRDQ